MVRIVVTGAAGRMGKAILSLALKDRELSVTGVVEAKGHPLVGQGADTLVGKTDPPLVVVDDLAQVVAGGDVVIDFTHPGPSVDNLRVVHSAGKAAVIGTTGFSGDQIREIEEKGKTCRIVLSPNMSVGMNLMFDLVERMARTLRTGYDVEIIEMHHRLKKDAPSGSALRLKEAVLRGHPERAWEEVFGRKGIVGERRDEEIGVMSLRGGDVVGEHTVFFAGTGERLEVTHRATSRENFARGALLAAKWIVTKGPGLYSMKDVLDL